MSTNKIAAIAKFLKSYQSETPNVLKLNSSNLYFFLEEIFSPDFDLDVALSVVQQALEQLLVLMIESPS